MGDVVYVDFVNPSYDSIDFSSIDPQKVLMMFKQNIITYQEAHQLIYAACIATSALVLHYWTNELIQLAQQLSIMEPALLG